MRPREIAAWTIATLAVFALICVLASDWDHAPKWTLINTKQGAIRMDLSTGRTEWLRGRYWYVVEAKPDWAPLAEGSAAPFNPDEFIEKYGLQPQQ